MDLTRIEGTFKAPDEIITIIGCGAIGSQIAIQLAKLGCEKFKLYDIDMVEPHNLVNQAFRTNQIGTPKTDALAELLGEINAYIKTECIYREDPTQILIDEESLEGYVFLCPDKVSVRKHCLTKNKTNPNILGWFDCRTELWAAQCFCIQHTAEGIKNLLETLNFSDSEAEENIPRATSGCHSKLAAGTTSALGALTLAKLFIDVVKQKKYKFFTRIDTENWLIEP